MYHFIPSQPCPSCGHCPTCGRGGHYTQPYQPYPWSNPWYTYTTYGTGDPTPQDLTQTGGTVNADPALVDLFKKSNG